MRPFVITGIVMVVLAVPTTLVIEGASLGPWAAAGVATVAGTIVSLIGLRAFNI